MERINELAIFAGAGGGLLASQILGWNTILAIEYDAYAASILAQRQNDRIFRPFPIWSDVRTFNGKAWKRYTDLVSGGFPCQAFSTAAHGANIAEKNLWPEMRRIVGETEPYFVFVENVSRKAIDKACDDLEEMGYKTKAIPLSAKDLGSDHIRERYWLLAYADDPRKLLCRFHAKTSELPKLQTSVWSCNPEISRMDDGVANRVDRLKTTGNGQVPVVAAAACLLLIEAIMEDWKNAQF